MAQKKATVDIDIQGLNTIGQLEDALEQINQEIKDVDKNSDAFQQLSKQARDADGQLRTLNTELEGVTSTEKADGILKLGEGFGGAFVAVQGLGLALGQTNEDLEQTIAQVGGLIAALDGIRRVTEALSAQNLKLFRATIDGFKQSAVAARLFGTTTRAALTATGLGALIVLIGLIIANFDKLRDVVQENFDKIKKALLIITPPLGLIVAGIDKIAKKVGDLQNLFAGLGAFIKSVFTIDGTGLDGAVEAFDEVVEKEQELDEIRSELNEKIEETTEEYDKQRELLELQGADAQTLLDLEKERLETERELLERAVATGRAKEEEKERLKEIVFELEKIEIKQENINDAVEQEQLKRTEAAEKIRKQQDAQLKARVESLRSANEQLNTSIKRLEFERELLNVIKEYYEIANQNQPELNEAIAENTKQIETQLVQNNELNTAIDLLVQGYKDYKLLQSQIIQGDAKSNELLRERTKELLPSQLRLTTETYTQLEGLLLRSVTSLETYRENLQKITGLNLENLEDTEILGILLQENVNVSRASLELQSEEGRRISQNRLEDAANELGLIRTIEELTQAQIQNELALQQELRNKLDLKREDLQLALDALEPEIKQVQLLREQEERRLKNIDANIKRLEQQARETENLEEEEKIRERINTLSESREEKVQDIADAEDRVNTLLDTQDDFNSKIRTTKDQINKTDNDIIRSENEIAQSGERVRANQEAISAELIEQSRIYRLLQEQVDLYGQALTDALQSAFEVANVAEQNRLTTVLDNLEIEEREFEKTLRQKTKDYEDHIDEIKDAEKGLQDELEDINDELRDASGDRFDELLERREEVIDSIDVEQQREKELTNAKLKAEYELAVNAYEQELARGQAQEQAAKAEKRQAAILAVVNTALAVVKALPNIPLSIIAGVLGAAGAATIAAQKIPKFVAPLPPPPPEYLAEGGLLEGAKHKDGGIPIEAEGGEYVVNANATAQYLPLIDAINNMGRTKMQEGGIIDAPVTNVAENDFINYQKLSKMIGQEIANLTVVTELVPLSRQLKNINKTQSRAGLR